MQIAARNVFTVGGGAPLPYDAEVEYLESQKSGYIDTGVSSLGSIVGVNVSFQYTNPSNRAVGMTLGTVYLATPNIGVNSDWEDYGFGIGGPRLNMNINLWSRTSIYSALPTHTVQQCIINRNDIGLVLDGNVLLNQVTAPAYQYVGTADPHILLFAAQITNDDRHEGVGTYGMWGRIYHCDISADGNMVRDFYPVRFTNELGQTEGAMYDIISGTLFRKHDWHPNYSTSGSGDFIIGPDK